MEPGLRIGIGRLTTAFLLVLILIGVPLERKHAVRLLELVVGGGALDIEHGVVAARRRSHGGVRVAVTPTGRSSTGEKKDPRNLQQLLL